MGASRAYVQMSTPPEAWDAVRHCGGIRAVLAALGFDSSPATEVQPDTVDARQPVNQPSQGSAAAVQAGNEGGLYFDLDDYKAVHAEVLRCGRSAVPRLQLLGQWGAVPAATLASLRRAAGCLRRCAISRHTCRSPLK